MPRVEMNMHAIKNNNNSVSNYLARAPSHIDQSQNAYA